MLRFNEIIEKLPAELRMLASVYLPLFSRMDKDDLAGWIGNVIDGNTVEAYKGLVRQMKTNEIMASLKIVNDRLISLNITDTSTVQKQRQFVYDALRVVFVWLLRTIDNKKDSRG